MTGRPESLETVLSLDVSQRLCCAVGTGRDTDELVISLGVSSSDKPLVFLCGNLRKETIPQSLTKAGMRTDMILTDA